MKISFFNSLNLLVLFAVCHILVNTTSPYKGYPINQRNHYTIMIISYIIHTAEQIPGYW